MNEDEVRYVCTKCIKGDCVRYKKEDTDGKVAFKCDKCGHIHYVRRRRTNDR